MPPHEPPDSPEVAALSNLVAALREQLSESGELNQVLRAENRRLTAALAVERAVRDPDALDKARRELHDTRYRLSRLMRVFGAVGVEPPEIATTAQLFVTDAFLHDVAREIATREAKAVAEARKHAERREASNGSGDREERGVSEGDKEADTSSKSRQSSASHELNNAFKAASDPAIEGVPLTESAMQVSKDASDAAPVDQTNGQRGSADDGEGREDRITAGTCAAGPSKVDVPMHNLPAEEPPEGPAIVVDETNPAAECLRMLVGASAIKVYENPRRILITMRNHDKNRELSFWITWESGQMAYKQNFINLEMESRPDFLNEPAIEFEIAQGPNFMVLVMAAMFDFTVDTKKEPRLEEV